jgi:hypothetical protein
MFESCHEQEVCLFPEVSRLALGPTQAPAHLIQVAVTPGLTRLAIHLHLVPTLRMSGAIPSL